MELTIGSPSSNLVEVKRHLRLLVSSEPTFPQTNHSATQFSSCLIQLSQIITYSEELGE